MRCLHLPAFAGEGRDGGAQGAASWRLRWWEVGRWPENMGTGGETDQTFLIGSFFGLIQMCVAVFQELIKKNRFIWRFSFNQEVMVALGSNWQ